MQVDPRSFGIPRSIETETRHSTDVDPNEPAVTVMKADSAIHCDPSTLQIKNCVSFPGACRPYVPNAAGCPRQHDRRCTDQKTRKQRGHVEVPQHVTAENRPRSSPSRTPASASARTFVASMRFRANSTKAFVDFNLFSTGAMRAWARAPPTLTANWLQQDPLAFCNFENLAKDLVDGLAPTTTWLFWNLALVLALLLWLRTPLDGLWAGAPDDLVPFGWRCDSAPPPATHNKSSYLGKNGDFGTRVSNAPFERKWPLPWHRVHLIAVRVIMPLFFVLVGLQRQEAEYPRAPHLFSVFQRLFTVLDVTAPSVV